MFVIRTKEHSFGGKLQYYHGMGYGGVSQWGSRVFGAKLYDTAQKAEEDKRKTFYRADELYDVIPKPEDDRIQPI